MLDLHQRLRPPGNLLDWQYLVRLSDRELARVDIAVMNLACAVGLPGSERIDFGYCLRTLDQWGRYARQFTDRVMPMFHSGRCDYADSEPRFRIQAMVTALQVDLGVRYHPGRRAEDAVFEPVDSFLHGIIQGEGGTCGSLPVLYAAVGRRLGYPLMLALTRSHLFARWDALPRGECFNIEGAGDGISFFPDEYFHTGRFEMPLETVRACGYLQSLSPREELAAFLSQRAECWMQEKVYGEAVTAFAWSHELDPGRWYHEFLARQAMRKWDEQLRSMLPPHFPVLDIGLPPQQFRQLPRELEREIIRMRIMETVLRDPDYERRWWGPSRQHPRHRPNGLPEKLRINYRWNFAPRDPGLNA